MLSVWLLAVETHDHITLETNVFATKISFFNNKFQLFILLLFDIIHFKVQCPGQQTKKRK